jgi:hypothetical protein
MNEDEEEDIVYAVRSTHPVFIYLFRRLRDYDKRQSGNPNYNPWRDGPIIGGCAL